MSDPEIKYLGDVQRVQLNPEDTLVISVDFAPSYETRNRIMDVVKSATNHDKVVILECGTKIGVLGA